MRHRSIIVFDFLNTQLPAIAVHNSAHILPHVTLKCSFGLSSDNDASVVSASRLSNPALSVLSTGNGIGAGFSSFLSIINLHKFQSFNSIIDKATSLPSDSRQGCCGHWSNRIGDRSVMLPGRLYSSRKRRDLGERTPV